MSFPNPENVEAQVDEAVVLHQIYGEDEFLLLSHEFSAGDDDQRKFEHPIRYAVRLSSDVTLTVQYPPNYPEEGPILAVEIDDGVLLEECLDTGSKRRFPHDGRQPLLEAMQDAIEIGIPCVMQCVQAGKDFLSSQQEEQGSQESGETKNEAPPQEPTTPPHLNHSFFDKVPRPVLNTILSYCAVRDRGRLCVASQLIHTVVERRSTRILQEAQKQQNRTATTDGDNGWEWRYTEEGMTIDGEHLERWEVDIRRADEEHQSGHEQLWRRERSCQFDFSLPEQRWRLQEGLMRTNRSNEDSFVEDDHYRTWIGGVPPDQEEFFRCAYTFHYLRTSQPVHFSDRSDTRWYLVRVRLRGHIARDGDVFVGLVHAQHFDKAPTESFGGTHPGGGFWAQTERCAFINVISGDNAAGGHPLEVNLGLKMSRRNNSKSNLDGCFRYEMSYGIPVGAYFGRPEFNQGKVHSDWDSFCDVHVAVVVAATTEQADFKASIAMQKCSQQEWKRKMVQPYNFL